MSDRLVGTTIRGIRCPIINQSDDVEQIIIDSLVAASKSEKISFQDNDVLAVTESIIARAQGNYATIDDIAFDIKSKFGDDTVGLIFPILSRNRFANCLRGIAKGSKKIVLMLSYPADEVGNHLISLDQLDEKGINPWTDTLTEAEFKDLFGDVKHPFTGINYIEYYKSLIAEFEADYQIIFSNNPKTILDYTKSVLVCDVHTRTRTKRILKDSHPDKLYDLTDILAKPINNSGFNQQFGLLGANKAKDDSVKLFPRDCQAFVDNLQHKLSQVTGKKIEVMIYGDGAFKDPVGKIWELADPVVSPAYTSGLTGTPNEIKLKYLADNNFSNLHGKAQSVAISDFINHKNQASSDSAASQGTTPRQLSDLLGSLADLTSGSGDKGTPIVLIQGYFDNFSD